MVTRQRRSWLLFAAGAAGGAVIVIVAWLAIVGTNRMPWEHEPAPQRQARTVVEPTKPVAAPAAPAATVAAAESVPISVSTCPPQPAVPVNASSQDGAFALQAAMEADPLPNAAAFLAVGREAAQQGRVRDAEVAFIAACNVAERRGGSHSARVADAKAQLGEHYLAQAARAGAEDNGLFQRASALFSESADAYAVSLGKNASRTRLAEQRLAAVRTGSALEASARMPAPMQSTSDSTVLGAAAISADDAARSSARELISSDPELSQMESDIGRLQAQASRVTRDPVGLRKRDAEAQARRDAQCQDKACLLRWYAQRRSQLLNEF